MHPSFIFLSAFSAAIEEVVAAALKSFIAGGHHVPHWLPGSAPCAAALWLRDK